MSLRPLDLDIALTAFFDRQAEDTQFRRTCHPQMSELGWAAYKDFLQRRKLDPHVPRAQDGRAHVSHTVGPVGFNCDRAVFFQMACFEEEAPATEAELHLNKQLMRCFEIGHALEESLYQWMAPAFELYYGPQGITLTDIAYEWPIYQGRDKDDVSEEAALLVGTADVRLDYVTADGEKGRAIIDFKSSSSNRGKQRQKVTGIEAEAEYLRQVSVYLEATESDWGALVYWIKQWPHHFQQAPVERRPGLYLATLKRLEQIAEDVDLLRPSPANRGAHCSRCRFQQECAAIDQGGAQ